MLRRTERYSQSRMACDNKASEGTTKIGMRKCIFEGILARNRNLTVKIGLKE